VRTPFCCAVLGAAALAVGEDAATPEQAIAKARPLLDAAIAAAPVANKDTKDFKVIADGIRAGFDALKGLSKEGLKDPSVKATWNEAVSLAHYHGLKPIPDYQVEKRTTASYPVNFSLPLGRGWSLKDLVPQKGDQRWAEITKTLPNGRVVRQVIVWVYLWQTLYSVGGGKTIGGENAKELAETGMEFDRERFSKIKFRSNRIVTARLSKGFSKASYYEIVGEEKSLGDLRRRNYYVKGETATYCFEVLEFRKTAPEDDAWTKWQSEGDDPELALILESLADGGGMKK